MVFLSFRKPKNVAVARCLDSCPHGSFNYDSKYRGKTLEEFELLEDSSLRKDGFEIDFVRAKVGTGSRDYRNSLRLINNWAHFQLPWAQVKKDTTVKVGQKFCVVSKVLFLWTLNPLEILYVRENHLTKGDSKNFTFGSGTLKGHFLSGEERFAVEWDPVENSVWYSILAISKPANILAKVSYPLVRHLQAKFRKDSVNQLKLSMKADNLTKDEETTP